MAKVTAETLSLSPEETTRRLSEGLVEIFSDLADLFGNPRSHGAIYGLLFASEAPLSMEDIAHRLNISKGSACQGLRKLEELGAVTKSREENSRTHHYEAKLELKPLFSGFLGQRLIPRLQNLGIQLDSLHVLTEALPDGKAANAKFRLDRLTKWQRNASSVLPILRRLMLGA